mmetsp:Transcript_4127/g.11928  ORF Transcript_4127/g.11928 Transcript_4127/m.11928 type:complete len:253 (+) Transcript_4127:273-1031(+)
MAGVSESLGVCPQFDVLWPPLTVLDHFLFYTRLAGVPRADESTIATAAAAAVGLGHKLATPVSKLSGGQKRRVSLGVSLVGSPAVVFLDEPTTGLDPATKKMVWKLIEIARHGRVVVLTTHSMEEADALCTRIGIMIQGNLRVLGTTTRLKSKFGEGYKVDIVFDHERAADARAFMAKVLPGTPDTASSDTATTYHVTGSGSQVSMGTVVEKMSRSAEAAGIVDWGLRQTSLEEVFRKLAQEVDDSGAAARS